jgi:cytochrome b subunit of formate dehydrogenase
MNWILQNWNSILTVASAVLALGVTVSHTAHKEDVATRLTEIEDVISDLQKK